MKRWPVCFILLVLVPAGCSSGPRHLPAAEFQRRYEESKANSLEGYSYVGETNEAVYVLRRRVPLLFGSKPHEKMFFTEIQGLTPGFVEQLRRESASHPTEPPDDMRR